MCLFLGSNGQHRHAKTLSHLISSPNWDCVMSSQINENVKREVLNHRQLTHDHVIQFREVRSFSAHSQALASRL